MLLLLINGAPADWRTGLLHNILMEVAHPPVGGLCIACKILGREKVGRLRPLSLRSLSIDGILVFLDSSLPVISILAGLRTVLGELSIYFAPPLEAPAPRAFSEILEVLLLY